VTTVLTSQMFGSGKLQSGSNPDPRNKELPDPLGTSKESSHPA